MINNFISAYKTINEEISSGSNIKNVIYNGLLNLSVVEIIVEKSENAQAIFESINSLGVKLTTASSTVTVLESLSSSIPSTVRVPFAILPEPSLV